MNRFLLSLLVLLSFINICSGLKCYQCSSATSAACKKSQTSKTCTVSSPKCFDVVKTTGGVTTYTRGCNSGSCTTTKLCPNTTTCVMNCCSTDNCNDKTGGAEMLHQGILPILSAVVMATLYIVF